MDFPALNPDRNPIESMLGKALRSARSRSATVNKVKKFFYLAEVSVGLTWVKAHASDPGNELVDQQAKLATAEGEKLEIPTPYSCVKFKIEKNLMNDWKETWNDYDFESGRRIRDFVPKVNRKFLVFSKYLIFFLSGHGPFPYYLNRFKKLISSYCPGGSIGNVDHYVCRCQYTKDFHLKEPIAAHRQA
ncbi:hypothetical protein AVEN_16556-1 [Araneus ventricosus]|uniref:RNase H type-1 domain-containing protein n=1 Tax=Araneus ventricosus TaxID=182803 RepID=A0A4Y2N1Z7_ARAVE|nr:hypothetical protein AVEN_16556-1 [Araneus ventricosus]